MSGNGDGVPAIRLDGPQATAADAYRHAADMAAAIAARARRRWPLEPLVYVRVEEVEHLAAGLAARAEETA